MIDPFRGGGVLIRGGALEDPKKGKAVNRCWGHMVGNWRCRLVKVPYKTLCFCAFYENDRSETSQAQHIQLAKNLIKPCFYWCFECAAGANWGHMAGNWWCRLVKIPYKTLCFLAFYENDHSETSQAQHIQLAENLIKPCFYWCFECAAGANWGHMAGNWRCQLVKIPYKTLCFCAFYENDHSEASQAQHNQLQWKHIFRARKVFHTLSFLPSFFRTPPGGGSI